MRNFRERYWRYSLFVLILGLGITICIELTPFLGGLLGAATIYVLLRRQMQVLTACRRWRRSLAASLLLAEAVLCFLVPISLIVWMVVNQVQDITLRPDLIITPLKHIAALIHEKTGYNLWQEENISSMIGMIPKLGQWVVSSIFDFGVNIVVLLFVLYFMLIGGRRMEEYCREILPFDSSVSGSVMREVHMIVRSNAIGIPLLAAVQGVVAYLGYLLFGAPSPLFWGVLTCLATIIPIVGTALVWLPLALYMGLEGNWGPAVGLALYGTLVVTSITSCGSSCRNAWPTPIRSSPSSAFSSAFRSSGSWVSSSDRCCWPCSFSASICSNANTSTANPTASFSCLAAATGRRGRRSTGFWRKVVRMTFFLEIFGRKVVSSYRFITFVIRITLNFGIRT